jgi:uncharacterized protein (DUF2267 family)
MDDKELTLLVKSDGGLRTAAEARRALEATLGALGCAMDRDDVRATSKALPATLARVLERGPMTAVSDAPGLYAEVERRERVALGFAVEHAQVVLRVLAHELDAELVVRLRKRLPPDIAVLLRPNVPSAEPPPHVHAHPAHRPAEPQTLARARPGNSEPIADTRHELAHAESVVRSQAPHADRMVETAHSTRPGREDDTLAAARGDEKRR